MRQGRRAASASSHAAGTSSGSLTVETLEVEAAGIGGVAEVGKLLRWQELRRAAHSTQFPGDLVEIVVV